MRPLLPLVLTVLVVVAVIVVSTTTQASTQTVLRYRPKGYIPAFYVVRADGGFVYTGHVLDDYTVTVRVTNVNESGFAFVNVYISGSLVYVQVLEGLQAGLLQFPSFGPDGEVDRVDLTLRFEVDVKTNYAWLGDFFLGFSALYLSTYRLLHRYHVY